jgi:hypothetical protein
VEYAALPDGYGFHLVVPSDAAGSQFRECITHSVDIRQNKCLAGSLPYQTVQDDRFEEG